MKRNRITLLLTGSLAVTLAAGLSACDQSKRQARARPTEIAPAPAHTIEVPLKPRPAQVDPLGPEPRKAVEILLESVEAAFRSGEESYRKGRLEQARRDFDRALDWILISGIELKEDPRLEALFYRVVETVHAYDAAAFRNGESLTERASEPAPIDEIAELTLPEDPGLRESLEREILSAPHDLPLVLNDEVLKYVNFFQTPRGRAIVETGLARAGKYKAMIERVFQEEGLPLDLIFLAQAESAFKPKAVSRARARGIWQFMAPRAREYGLNVSWWVDERQDPEKSTRAAARHLRDLYKEFRDWHLVLAAYNSGPGNVSRAIERTGYSDFWELHRRNVLPRETRNHVPIILAMAIVAKNPQRFGIRVQPEPPVETDRVKPGHAIDLRLAAEAVNVSVDALRELNPHLLQNVTPNDPEFELCLPVGTAERFFAEIAEIPREKWIQWRSHRIAAGDTLSGLAKTYRVTPTAIAEVNGIRLNSLLRVGDRLIIPSTSAPVVQGQLVRYRVRRGDTLSEIAQQFSVSVDDLRRWNGIRGSRIVRGAVLKVYPAGLPPPPARRTTASASAGASAETGAAAESADGSQVHRVKPGETLWSIARAYRTTVEALRAANQFLISRQLRAGDQLVILGP